MKKFLLTFMSFLMIISIFSCPAPATSGNQTTSSGDSNEAAPLPPHVTVDDLKNTSYAGERTVFADGEDKSMKYLYITFTSTSSGKNVGAQIGRGKTAEEAKNQVSNSSTKYESVTIDFPLTLKLGNSLTLYMAEDLQSATTKTRIYSGNSIAHVKDATLYKQ